MSAIIETAKGDQCCICFDAFAPGEKKVTHVGGENHDGFHSNCLADWLITKATCPQDRMPIDTNCALVRERLVVLRNARIKRKFKESFIHSAYAASFGVIAAGLGAGAVVTLGALVGAGTVAERAAKGAVIGAVIGTGVGALLGARAAIEERLEGIEVGVRAYVVGGFGTGAGAGMGALAAVAVGTEVGAAAIAGTLAGGVTGALAPGGVPVAIIVAGLGAGSIANAEGLKESAGVPILVFTEFLAAAAGVCGGVLLEIAAGVSLRTGVERILTGGGIAMSVWDDMCIGVSVGAVAGLVAHVFTNSLLTTIPTIGLVAGCTTGAISFMRV